MKYDYCSKCGNPREPQKTICNCGYHFRDSGDVANEKAEVPGCFVCKHTKNLTQVVMKIAGTDQKLWMCKKHEGVITMWEAIERFGKVRAEEVGISSWVDLETEAEVRQKLDELAQALKTPQEPQIQRSVFRAWKPMVRQRKLV